MAGSLQLFLKLSILAMVATISLNFPAKLETHRQKSADLWLRLYCFHSKGSQLAFAANLQSIRDWLQHQVPVDSYNLLPEISLEPFLDPLLEIELPVACSSHTGIVETYAQSPAHRQGARVANYFYRRSY